MSSLKAAVIGCGGHAQLHLRMIDKEPRLHLVGVAEIDATRREQAQAEWRVEGFADYRRMLDACKPDLVVVATMPGHLTAIVIDCLERGVHTSVEKALGMHADETRAMAAAARCIAPRPITSRFLRQWGHRPGTGSRPIRLFATPPPCRPFALVGRKRCAYGDADRGARPGSRRRARGGARPTARWCVLTLALAECS